MGDTVVGTGYTGLTMSEVETIANSEEDEEEEVFLCKLFGDDGRFVEFINLTGRPVRLTSRLQMENFSYMAWSTTFIIPQGGKHVWRFLGESPKLSLYFLSMLPDPYLLARKNSYKWVAEYLDTKDQEGITFDNTEGPLMLDMLEEQLPLETITIRLRRKGEATPMLHKLAMDAIVRNSTATELGSSMEDIPRTLVEELLLLRKDYEEIEKRKLDPCKRCQEIHQ